MEDHLPIMGEALGSISSKKKKRDKCGDEHSDEENSKRKG